MVLLAITPFWYGLVACAFGCALCIITVDTAWSDAKQGRRGKMIALAVLFALASIYFIVQTVKHSN